MSLVLYFIIVLAIVFLIIWLCWRNASGRQSIPCPVWMKFLLDPQLSGRVSRRTQNTIDVLDVRPGMNILDAGCGPGRLTIPLAEITGPDGKVTAFDIQEGMLDEVKKRAKKKNLVNIRYIQCGLGEGRLEADCYDRAVLITVLGEIPDMKAALKEIYVALKPGGILLVEETIRDPHFQARSKVTELAGAFGFMEKDFFGNRFSYILTLKKTHL